ncbi:hypothetical protein PFISCL1PPCAC_5939, partial [Pristionchus fissidentatus]
LLHSMSDFDWSDGDVDEGGRREEDEEDIEDYSNEDIDVELPECPIGEQSFQCRTDADNLPYFMSASPMTPAPLRQLFRFRIEEKWIGHSFPKHPHLNQADLWTIIYPVDSESIASGDSPIDDDLYAPWTKAGRSCQTWSYPCQRKDDTITECSDGSLILRVIKYTHPVCVGLELYVARVEDSGVVTGTMLLAYTSKKFGDRNPPVRAKNKRIDSISKREIKQGYAIGQSARAILHSLSAPGILPHQVYNQGRKMERRRSNRGRLPHIDNGKIVEWKATGDFLSERTTHGNTHYFLSTKLSKEILLSNLVEHKELMERREEIKNQIDLWDGEIPTTRENLQGVAQLDVTFCVAEGYYLTVFAVDVHQFRVQSSGGVPLVPVAFMFSQKHDARAMQYFGEYVNEIIDNPNLRLAGLICDQEISFDHFLKAEFASDAIRVDCVLHRIQNIERSEIGRVEAKEIAKILFGEIDDFGVLIGGVLNSEDEEHARELLESEELSHAAYAWITKRLSTMYKRLSVRSRLEAGIMYPLPDSNRIESLNGQIKSFRERRRRTIDQAIALIKDQLQGVLSDFRAAESGGGYFAISEVFARKNFPSLGESLEKTSLHPELWPVPAGPARVALDKSIQKWELTPVHNGFRLESSTGELVGVTILPEHGLRCTSPACSRLKILCVHRLRVLSILSESQAEEFYLTRVRERSSSMRKPVDRLGGDKPGHKRKVRRRGNDRPEIIGMKMARRVDERYEREEVHMDDEESLIGASEDAIRTADDEIEVHEVYEDALVPQQNIPGDISLADEWPIDEHGAEERREEILIQFKNLSSQKLEEIIAVIDPSIKPVETGLIQQEDELDFHGQIEPAQFHEIRGSDSFCCSLSVLISGDENSSKSISKKLDRHMSNPEFEAEMTQNKPENLCIASSQLLKLRLMVHIYAHGWFAYDHGCFGELNHESVFLTYCDGKFAPLIKVSHGEPFAVRDDI